MGTIKPGEELVDFEERAILSRRRAVVFIFLMGMVVLVLLFLIRVDVHTKSRHINTHMRLVEKTSPVFVGPVKMALNTGKDDVGTRISSEIIYYQRHPKELLGRLFG